MNNFPSKKEVNKVKEKYPVGSIVELTSMDDAQAPPIGTKGVVTAVDDIGSIHVKWETGSRLAVLYGEDACKIVKKAEK